MRTHFAGMPSAHLVATGTVTDRAPDDVGRELLSALRLTDVAIGTRAHVDHGAPLTTGTVVDVGSRSVTLRTDRPRAGIVEFGVFDHAGAAVLVRGYLVGAGAEQVAARESRRWSAWLADAVPGLVPLT